jgi:hypothetical protein
VGGRSKRAATSISEENSKRFEDLVSDFQDDQTSPFEEDSKNQYPCVAQRMAGRIQGQQEGDVNLLPTK